MFIQEKQQSSYIQKFQSLQKFSREFGPWFSCWRFSHRWSFIF